MKRYFLHLLLLVFLNTHPTYADIDSQIEAIQHASASERFKLMNAFKKKLILMKENERLKAMTKLVKHSNNPLAHRALNSLKKEKKLQQLKQQLENDTIVIDNITAETIDSIGGDDDNDD